MNKPLLSSDGATPSIQSYTNRSHKVFVELINITRTCLSTLPMSIDASVYVCKYCPSHTHSLVSSILTWVNEVSCQSHLATWMANSNESIYSGALIQSKRLDNATERIWRTLLTSPNSIFENTEVSPINFPEFSLFQPSLLFLWIMVGHSICSLVSRITWNIVL